MTNWMVASVEFLGLVYYEAILAVIMGAFSNISAKRKKYYIFFALLPLALMTMFRSETIGNDTKEYIKLFESVKALPLSYVLQNSRFEKGYLLYTYLLTKLSDNHQILLITSGAFFYYSLARWLNKWCKSPGVVVCLLVDMLYIDNWMSSNRQTLAFFILLFAFDYLVEHRFVRFLLLTLLAAQFHNVAYIFLLAWPICNFNKKDAQIIYSRRNEKRYTIIVAITTIIMFALVNPIINYFVKLFPVYRYYLFGGYMDGKARLAVILNILVYGIMLLIPYLLGNNYKNMEHTSYRLTIRRFAILSLAFWFLANKATLVNRCGSVYAFFALADYAESVREIHSQTNKRTLLIMTLILFAIYGLIITLLKTPEWQTTYPFKWCFI